MNKRLVYVFLLSITLIGCASTHPGRMAKTIEGSTEKIPVKVSAKSIDAKVEDTFQLIEITIENASDGWVRIAKGDLVVEDPSQSKVSAVLGKDLTDWSKAMRFRILKDKQNTDVAQALLLGGAVAAAGVGQNNNNNALLAAAAITYVGTSGWAVSDAIKADLRRAEGVNTLPEDHFFSSYSVPGKMFARKWILLNKPSGQLLNTLVIRMESVEQEKGTYEINLQ